MKVFKLKIIKYVKSILWAIGFSVFSANSIAATVVSFNISNTDIQINETFSVDVLVSGVDSFDEVIAFGFDLTLDPTWSLGLVTIGSSFDFDDSTLFPNTDVAGSVDPFNFGPNGDNIVLASLQLSATKAGDFNLGINSNLFDFNEGLYLLSSFNAVDISHNQQIAINSPVSTVPVPGALLLFISGMLSLLGYKRA